MAGSRFERIGTIFSRATGLIRTGVINYEDRPLWYDIYRVFPPKFEPHFDRKPVLLPGMTEEIPEILYNEDPVRAAFYHKFGPNPGGTIRNLSNLDSKDISQDFVDQYNETKKSNPDLSMEQIIEIISPNFSYAPTTRQKYKKLSKFQGEHQQQSEEFMGSSRRSSSRKAPVVTAETLLSMFKEAKGEADKK